MTPSLLSLQRGICETFHSYVLGFNKSPLWGFDCSPYITSSPHEDATSLPATCSQIRKETKNAKYRYNTFIFRIDNNCALNLMSCGLETLEFDAIFAVSIHFTYLGSYYAPILLPPLFLAQRVPQLNFYNAYCSIER